MSAESVTCYMCFLMILPETNQKNVFYQRGYPQGEIVYSLPRPRQ